VPVDPEIQGFLDGLADAGFPEPGTLEPAEMRVIVARTFAPVGGPDVARVETHALPGPEGVEAIVYTPYGETPFPLLVFFHGGGWVFGSAAASDDTCRTYSSEAGCVVVNVDYRLAPEHLFPAAVDDCYGALVWAVENARDLGIDPARVVVAGDSAGGNLAAAVALRARDRGGPAIALQVLGCPITDCTFEQRSYVDNASGYVLTARSMRWFWDHYLPLPADRSHPEAAPLRAASLAGLPAAYVVTAEYDPLRDEGAQYADRLRAEGVPVAHRDYLGAIHGFHNGPTAIGRGARRDLIDAVRTAVGGC
jgi:acetyl esterase